MNRLGLFKIQKAFKKDTITIDGHMADYWIKELKVPEEFSFDMAQSNVITFNKKDYFIVNTSCYGITFGRFGYGTAMRTKKVTKKGSYRDIKTNKLAWDWALL